MTEIFANNADGVLASEAADTDTSISLEAGHTFPSPGSGDFFRATLFEVSGGEEVNHEIVKVTDVTNDVMTVERAQEGTTARTWAAGTGIELRLTAGAVGALPKPGTVWQSTAPADTDVVWIRPQLQTTGDYVYTASDDNTVRRITSGGSESWSFTGHSNAVKAVAVDSNGNVYSASGDQTVRKIDNAGSQVWSYTGHSSFVVAVAVDVDGGNVYSGENGGMEVHKIDSNGNQVWVFAASTFVNGVAVDGDGYVYAVDSGPNVYKIDPDGNQVWAYSGGESQPALSVAVDGAGYVYAGFGEFAYTVHKIDSGGSQVWSVNLGDEVEAVAVDGSGNVYAGTTGNTVFKLDPTGSEIWQFTGHGNTVFAVAVDADGYVYSASGDDTARKTDSDGNEVWSFTGHSNAVQGVAVDPPITVPAEAFVYNESSSRWESIGELGAAA